MDQTTQYHVTQAKVADIKTACIAVGIFQSRKLTAAAEQIDQASNGYLRKLLKHGDFSANIGDLQLLYEIPNIQAKRLLLVGCGPAGKTKLSDYQAIHSTLAKRLSQLKIREVVSFLTDIDCTDLPLKAAFQHAVLSFEYSFYRFEQYKTEDDKKSGKQPAKIRLAQEQRKNLSQHEEAVQIAVAIAHGEATARTLGNLPGNVCTPSYLAKQATALQRIHRSIKTSVLDEATMKRLGMHALLSVSRGSKQPAKLIVMEYRRSGKTNKPVVLVGKGITFDTGGISIKPSPQMDEMKFDMCGAASVLGVMTACAEMKLKANVIGVIASAENMPGGQALKPGDIVKSLSGKTIEILNTDAEGRLVLCDALSYVEQYNPAAVIDIATLTGACLIALGRIPSGLLGNNDRLLQRLQQSGERSGDRVWPLPLWPEYRELLKSNFADLANIGGRDAGTITAASFLSHFTESYPWAHLDIAGTAWKTGEEKGATGRPVRLLMEYIISYHRKRV